MVESREYPFLPVTLEVRNFHESVPAFVDTGFYGFLVLPDRYLPQLGPPDFVGRGRPRDCTLPRIRTRPTRPARVNGDLQNPPVLLEPGRL